MVSTVPFRHLYKIFSSILHGPYFFQIKDPAIFEKIYSHTQIVAADTQAAKITASLISTVLFYLQDFARRYAVFFTYTITIALYTL